MVQARRKKSKPRIVASAAVVLLAIVAMSAFVMLGMALGDDQAKEEFGLGSLRSNEAAEASFNASEKLCLAEGSGGSAAFDNAAMVETTSLTLPSERSITVHDPDPVVVLAAVDDGNPNTVAKAAAVGTTDPLPTAPRILPDVTGEGWMVGAASAYDLEDNDGWDATASGVKLTRYSVTVAVPISKSYLLGSAVEIVYGDCVVVATVTDTGGFEGYGRALDLAGGVWRALGASTGDEWGVRQIHYRFL